jgi:hypothetical protein
MPDPAVTCTDCGHQLDDLAEGAPCSSCGSIKRTHHRYLHDQVTAADSLSWQLEYGERQWQEQWSRLVRIYDDLAAIYSGSRLRQTTDGWRDTVRQFFVVCHHLADWLAKDQALPAAARDDVWGYLNNDPELALARDFSNTDKHRTRRNPTDRTVFIASITGGDAGPSVTITWEVSGSRQGTRDALELADGCLRSWRQFLTRHNLTEP